MMLSTMGERAKRFYDKNLWTKQQMHDVTRVGAITKEEYEIIVGEEYVE